ncbi:unnamed protein product [Bursaphelenchus okinawaensis]|uniref:Tyrosine phosphatase n=1 Tax=Bursaphelenchus okinawaensis TaxID=465554 RepID=A0A811LKW0_9BILA|nr:unnamed protein product [Bursaphelenchus okinawaensis]CAG9124319.1 unnamed protein product [Bursaphelenchus okinawaensis]
MKKKDSKVRGKKSGGKQRNIQERNGPKNKKTPTPGQTRDEPATESPTKVFTMVEDMMNKPSSGPPSKGSGPPSKGRRSKMNRAQGTVTQPVNNREKPDTQEQKDNCRRLVNWVIKTGPQGLIDMYNNEIKNWLPPCSTRYAFDANADKNRYNDVVCGDQHRVVLNLADGPHDYIHANEVSGFPLCNTFFCTQGPLANTIIDFYRMICQRKVGIIIMLCETVEMGKPKCAQYWPRKKDEKMSFGKFTVINKGTSTTHQIFTTELEVTSPAGKFNLKHFLWLGWPDRGVPSTTLCALTLLKAPRTSSSPTIVHCSAGIGRTGSVVAIEYVIQATLSLSTMNLAEMIKEVRSKRLLAVQTDVQFLYIARVLTEYYTVNVGKDVLQKDIKEFNVNAEKIFKNHNPNDVYAKK